MKILPVVIGVAVLIAIAKCDKSSEDSSSTDSSTADSAYTDDMETAADGFQESTGTVYDRAEGVEDVLQNAADERNAAIEESTDDK